jgi:hypothetical protein
METKTTRIVAELCQCKPVTARRWAAANGVQFIGEGRRKNYLWTEADIARFRERGRPGRPWPEKIDA